MFLDFNYDLCIIKPQKKFDALKRPISSLKIKTQESIMSTKRKQLANYLYNYLKTQNLPRAKFAELLANVGGDNVSERSVYYWETGEREPSINNLQAISKLLNVSIDELLKPDSEILTMLFALSNTSKSLLRSLLENKGTALFKISTTENDWVVNFNKLYSLETATAEYEEKYKMVFMRQRIQDFVKDFENYRANPDSLEIKADDLFYYINVEVACAEGAEETILYPTFERNIAFYAMISTENFDSFDIEKMGFTDDTPTEKRHENNINFNILPISNMPEAERNRELKTFNAYLEQSIHEQFGELLEKNIISFRKETSCITEYVDVSNDQRLEKCIMDFVELHFDISLDKNEIIHFLLNSYEVDLHKKYKDLK